MDANSIIAKAAGMMLQRGVASADVIRAVDQLHALAQRGRAVTVELHGLAVRLPARTDRQVPRGRMTRETRG